MPKYVCGGGGVVCFFILGVLVGNRPRKRFDVFSSLGISEGSLPTSAGVSVGVSVGVSLGKTLPIFSHP